jgi:NitT/TauT family transport system permease protein
VGSGTGRASRWVRLRRGLVGTLAIAGVAELVVRVGLIDQRFVPPPSRVLVRLGAVLTDPTFRSDLAGTMWVWAAGLLIATVLAVLLGLLLGTLPAVRDATRMVIDVVRPIPSVAWIPLALLVLGDGGRMKLTMVAWASLWPVLFNTVYAVRDVSPASLETARAFGLGPLAVLRRVVLPSAAPFIATGVRVSAALCLVVTISVELLAPTRPGIGTYIYQSTSVSALRTDLVLAGTLVAAVIGVLIDATLAWVAGRAFAWQAATGRAPG